VTQAGLGTPTCYAHLSWLTKRGGVEKFNHQKMKKKTRATHPPGKSSELPPQAGRVAAKKTSSAAPKPNGQETARPF